MFRRLRSFGTGLALAALVGGGVLAGCKKEASPGSPTVKGGPGMGPPTEESVEKQNRAKLLADLYELAPLNGGTVYVDEQHETWTRYPSGVMIRELLPSSEGLSPQLGQTVSINYVGTFPETGKVFDQNDKSKPLTFAMGSKNIIKGLSLGLQGMHVRGTRRIYVPGDLAYGALGNRDIGPNQPLIFEVELLSLKGDAITLTPDDLPKFEPLGPPGPSQPLPAAGSQPATTGAK